MVGERGDQRQTRDARTQRVSAVVGELADVFRPWVLPPLALGELEVRERGSGPPEGFLAAREVETDGRRLLHSRDPLELFEAVLESPGVGVLRPEAEQLPRGDDLGGARVRRDVPPRGRRGMVIAWRRRCRRLCLDTVGGNKAREPQREGYRARLDAAAQTFHDRLR